MEVRRYADADLTGLDLLWREAFPDDPPWNRAARAVPAKLAFQRDLLFVAAEGAAVIGSAMAGYDGHRGWLYAVAVRRDRRGRGIGVALVRHAEAALAALGCGKVNLQVRAGNDATAFWERLGYAVEQRVSMGRRLG